MLMIRAVLIPEKRTEATQRTASIVVFLFDMVAIMVVWEINSCSAGSFHA